MAEPRRRMGSPGSARSLHKQESTPPWRDARQAPQRSAAWVLVSPEALGQSHADPARLLLLLELVSSTPSHSVGRLAVTQPHSQEGAASFQVL